MTPFRAPSWYFEKGMMITVAQTNQVHLALINSQPQVITFF